MWNICVRRHFDAAHHLKGYDGPCAHKHGHRWEVEVMLSYAIVDHIGMAVDFKDVKAALDNILPDHRDLNDIYDFNPTAENLVQHFYCQLAMEFGSHLVSVKVWESHECYVEYSCRQ